MYRNPERDGLERPDTKSVNVIEEEDILAEGRLPGVDDPEEIEELPEADRKVAGAIGLRADARRRDPDEEGEEEEYDEGEFEDEGLEEEEELDEEFDEDLDDDDLDEDFEEDAEEDEEEA